MQQVLRIGDLPSAPLDAAAAFHAEYLAQAVQMLHGDAGALAIMLPEAGEDHDDWRRALARDLARKHAPWRVNLLGGGSETAREATLAYLGASPGNTGQYLALHDQKA